MAAFICQNEPVSPSDDDYYTKLCPESRFMPPPSPEFSVLFVFENSLAGASPVAPNADAFLPEGPHEVNHLNLSLDVGSRDADGSSSKRYDTPGSQSTLQSLSSATVESLNIPHSDTESSRTLQEWRTLSPGVIQESQLIDDEYHDLQSLSPAISGNTGRVVRSRGASVEIVAASNASRSTRAARELNQRNIHTSSVTSGRLSGRTILPRPLNPILPSTDAALITQNLKESLPQKGKRKSNTEAGREKIKSVRKAGACVRCRIYKESCDPGLPCVNCMRRGAGNTARIFVLPCSRDHLDEVIAFRAGNSRAGKFRSEPMKPRWSGEDTRIKTITLKYPFKSARGTSTFSASIQCHKFIQREWDVLVEPWTLPNGEIIELRSTAYACNNTEAGSESICNYLEACNPYLLEEASDGLEDDIMKLGIEEAQRYAQKYKDSAVALAMVIRATTFFSRTRMIMLGENSLELPYFGDDRFTASGIPIPAVLDYQVDYIVIQYMLKQMGRIAKRLKKILFGPNNKASWYEVYLTTFVLLCCLEVVHARHVQVLHRFTAERDNLLSQVESVGTRMLQEWKHSAKILIYHYQVILKGMVPFTGEWDQKKIRDIRSRGSVDEDAIAYMSKLAGLLKVRGKVQEINFQ